MLYRQHHERQKQVRAARVADERALRLSIDNARRAEQQPNPPAQIPTSAKTRRDRQKLKRAELAEQDRLRQQAFADAVLADAQRAVQAPQPTAAPATNAVPTPQPQATESAVPVVRPERRRDQQQQPGKTRPRS